MTSFSSMGLSLGPPSERRTVIGMRNRNEISDTILRRIERDLDLEEVRLMRGAD